MDASVNVLVSYVRDPEVDNGTCRQSPNNFIGRRAWIETERENIVCDLL